jgi:hypothetical protein
MDVGHQIAERRRIRSQRAAAASRALVRDVRDRSAADADDEEVVRHMVATSEAKRTLRTPRLANRVAIALDDNQARVG